MKKMYKQPIVEAVEVQLHQNLLAGSGEPGVLPNSGQNTSDLPQGGDIIGG
jgi:hypothetical protein